MSNSLINWSFKSIAKKISGLSSVLLGFILVVIIYSVITLQTISMEMREVAKIDIPLTEVISELEVLQLEKHIIFEQLRFVKEGESLAEAKATSTQLQAKFNALSDKVMHQLGQAESIIQHGMKLGAIAEKVTEHQRVIDVILNFQGQLERFIPTVERTFESIHTANSAMHWETFESELNMLDKEAIALLYEIEGLTEEIADNAEKHERQFFLVNTTLGISAFVIGIYLTIAIIASFRRRVTRLKTEIESFHDSLGTEALANGASKINVGKDEFSGLASSLNAVIDRFADELNNRYEVESQLIQLATTDKLTGAMNRHKWDDTLQSEISLAARGTPLSLIMVDLDHFKKINDTYGHDVGDKVLVEAVTLIKTTIRKSDWVFRLGGEEFAILIRNHQPQEVIAVAEKLRQAFEKAETADLPHFTASFGIAQLRSSDSVDTFIKRADEAVYLSKHEGRNRITEL